MRARFIGDPRNGGEGASALSFAGVAFVKGEWSDVPDAFAAKLAGNNHFEVDANEDEEADEITAVRAQLDELGVAYHPRLGLTKLTALLDEATAPPPPPSDTED